MRPSAATSIVEILMCNVGILKKLFGKALRSEIDHFGLADDVSRNLKSA